MRWGTLTVLVAIVVFLAASSCSDESDTAADGPTGATGVAGATTDPPARSGNGRNRDRGPTAAIEQYYDLLNARRYDEAWEKLPPALQVEVGGFDEWKAGYSTTIDSEPRQLTVDSSGRGRAVVSLDLSATDQDVCGDRAEQLFTGTWTLQEIGGEWMPEAIRFEKVSGRAPVLDPSACPSTTQDDGQPPPKPPPPAPTENSCTPGYSPCLPPDSDYDCEGGTGDGPSYTGTVQITGSDPYGLDSDNDGTGCDP